MWDFKRWTPDIVVVLLGSNDWVDVENPSEAQKEQFVQAYVELLRTIAACYSSDVKLVALCGGRDKEDQRPCSSVENAVKQYVACA